MQKNLTLPYCGELVRSADFDRFLMSLFVPKSVRDDVWAILAFNCEIAKTRSVVSETTLGLIRLQWWRDEIRRIYDGAPVTAHEVLKPLSEAIIKYKLPWEEFETLIHAREFDLEDVLPGNLEGLMNYADFTNTPLLKLIVRVLGYDPETLPLQPIGINAGLSHVMMNSAHYARTARCMLPEDLMQIHGVSREDFYNGNKPEEFSKIIGVICDAKVEGIELKLPFLKAVYAVSMMEFKKIKRLKYNVFSPKMINPIPFKVLRLWLSVKF